MIRIKVNTGRIAPRYRAMAEAMHSGTAANTNGADECVSLIRTHLAVLAQSRHKTAGRLGATPTGHIRAQAARRESVDAEGATIAVGIPGIGRAYRDIDIYPRRARSLTLPVHRLAYGRTVAEVKRERTIFRPKGKDYLASTMGAGTLTVLFLLRRHVHQTRDPSLMPAERSMREAYTRGWTAAVRRAQSAGGAV